MLQAIISYFEGNPFAFEQCAVTLVGIMDSNFRNFDLTRPWRDGGRDAIGSYMIGLPGESLTIECALEAKCHQTSLALESNR